MTTINTHCPACGEVSLTPDDIELRAEPPTDPEAFYAFGCPRCHQHVRKPADEQIIRLLQSAGVACRVRAPESAAPGPALTYDDLLDLHELLGTDDWFDELRASVRHELER